MSLSLGPDIRFALRSLRADPVFTGVAIISLAIGVCVTAGVVAVFEASGGQGSPFRNVDRAVAFYRTDDITEHGRFYTLSVAALQRVARESRTIASLGT